MKSEIAWHSDENGMMLGPRVHDGGLIEFAVSENGMEFGLRRVSGEIVRIELLGLHEFTVRELWNGAIVSDLWAWRLNSIPEALWSIPDSAWNILFSGRTRDEGKKREAARMIAAQPQAFLFQLTCSYGGNVAAVCEEIHAFEMTK